ncbi:ADH9 [Scenedesmus sp. PABB004]|nr:ADH9 [Scenedesmus sp. PABB004]
MPRIAVKGAGPEAGKAHPREFSLLHTLGDAGGIDAEALKAAGAKYGDAGAVAALSSGDGVEFDAFAKAFAKPSQAVEGSAGNTLGWAARDTSGTLAPYKFDRRALQPNDVMIKITHAGMCHSDLHTIRGDWGPAKYPVVPGHEIVGIVTEVGPAVTKFKPGDRAGVGVFVDTCRTCGQCKAGEQIFCPKLVYTYNSTHYDGLPAQGGYSTHIVMAEDHTYTIPANLELAGVAPLLCAGITTYAPFKDNGLDKPGLKIGVVGLGGLGHMAVKFGAAFGCEVYVISRSRAKEAEAKAMGATAVIPSGDAEAMKAAAGTLDGIIDTVSAKHDVAALMELLAPRGKLVIVGLPPEQPTINHFSLVMRNLTVAGSVIGNLVMTQEMLDFCGKHNITADVEVIDMDYVNAAMERMEAGDVKFRFVIDINNAAPMEPGDAGASPFARLPAEVLPRVLAELDEPERLGAAALVCRAWADAAAASSSEVHVEFGEDGSAAQRAAALSGWLARRGRGVTSLRADGPLFPQEPVQLALPLSELQGLRSLTCHSMDVAARGGGSGTLPALTRLILDCCALPGLLCPDLLELDVSFGHADAIVDLLHQAPALTMLGMSDAYDGSEALEIAAAVTGLRDLSMTCAPEDDDTIAVAIPPLASTLTHLDMDNLEGGVAGPAALVHLTGLECLRLRQATLVDPAAAFTPLTRLTALRLSLWQGGDSATTSALLRVLPHLARLQELSFDFGRHQILAGCADCASSIASLSQLSHLDLSGGGLAPGAAARLFARALPSLRRLSIFGSEHGSGAQLAKAELNALVGACPDLCDLTLGSCFKPGALRTGRLGLLSELTSLGLAGDCVRDADVVYLARALTALQNLDLSSAPRLGMRGVASLTDATRLTCLRVWQLCGTHDEIDLECEVSALAGGRVAACWRSCLPVRPR